MHCCLGVFSLSYLYCYAEKFFLKNGRIKEWLAEQREGIQLEDKQAEESATRIEAAEKRQDVVVFWDLSLVFPKGFSTMLSALWEKVLFQPGIGL